jgi:predicted aspartyl protease
MSGNAMFWRVAVFFLCGLGAARAQDTNSVTMPFTMSRGHVVVKVMLNGTPVSAMVDTGYEMTMVHPDVAEKLGLAKGGRMTIVGIAGEEPADVFSGATFAFSNVTYAPRRVAAIRAEKGRRGWEAVLGAGLFRRFVVEFRPTEKTLTLREPASFEYTGKGTIVPLEFRRRSATPIVEGQLVLGEGKEVQGRFELDTGCDGGLCLGKDFVEANRLIEASGATRPGGRRGVGGGASSVAGLLPELRLGGARVERPEVNFFTEGSPVDEGLAGHIGWHVLRMFDVVILDYSRRRMILER